MTFCSFLLYKICYQEYNWFRVVFNFYWIKHFQYTTSHKFNVFKITYKDYSIKEYCIVIQNNHLFGIRKKTYLSRKNKMFHLSYDSSMKDIVISSLYYKISPSSHNDVINLLGLKKNYCFSIQRFKFRIKKINNFFTERKKKHFFFLFCNK